DPSVQGYAGTQPEILTIRATNLEEKKNDNSDAPAVESESGPDEAVTHVSTVQANPEEVQPPAMVKPVKRSSLVYGAALLLLAAVAAAIWFARNSKVGDANTNSAVSINKPAPQTSSTPGAGERVESTADSKASNSNDSANSKAVPEDARQNLTSNLNDWVSATNARDLDRLVSFYAPVLTSFYTKRGVPQSEVRAEKGRLFSGIGSIDVRVSSPEIRTDAEGQNATMRFHKTWNFTGQHPERGEVIQELLWRRTDSGWKIISERDVEVIRINK
ncbi:MAG: nuclear transport factor 2 family protein, partial [Acidobacteriota bacterium]|nr:nuclear transport factor 2 family protein [Acidobacteriota bacterium]